MGGRQPQSRLLRGRWCDFPGGLARAGQGGRRGADRHSASGVAHLRAPLDQLALSPQCGFSSTVHGNNIAVEAQRNKLRLVIETAQDVWGD